MAVAEQPVVQTIESFLEQDQNKELLRFSTAGSVDDGKSTLIGRLLYDSKGIYEDQLAAVKKSAVNRASGPIDFSLVTDGLKAEREQGITIDVAYRYFSTARRKFIIADTPGHEQYTRNMATGASTADLAIILIDARHGATPQSRRHAYIAALLGIPEVAVAVNKMDLTGYSREVFEAIRSDFTEHLARLGVENARFFPISALEGDNVVSRSDRMPWYNGPSLLEHLETVPIGRNATGKAFRFPIQVVLRPDLDFRGYGGQIASGALRVGDEIVALPSGRTSRVSRIVTYDGDLDEAFAPMSVTICLEDELDISRGDMLVHPSVLPHVSRHFEAKLVWMHQDELEAGRPYWLKHTTQQVKAVVSSVRHRVDVNTVEPLEASSLSLNEIGTVEIESHRPLFFDSYRRNRATGSFILIDPLSNATVAAGMIEEKVARDTAKDARRALQELEFKASRVSPAELFARVGHFPATVWLTGRQEVAYALERRLFDRGCHVHVVADQVESRILPELAQLLNAAGLIAILSVSTTDSTERDRAVNLVGANRFLEFPPGALDASDDRATAQVIAALERRGVIRRDERFSEGEGI